MGEEAGRDWVEDFEDLAKFSIDHSSQEVYWITPDGGFVYVNEAARDRLGYTKDELKEMNVWDVDPDHGKEMREDRWRKLRKEESLTFESTHKTKDGEIYPVEITSHLIEFEGNEYEFAFAKDITERKRTEEELREKSEKYREVFNQTHDSMWVVDVRDDDFVYEEVNPQFYEFSGREEGEIVGNSLKELYQPETVKRIRKDYEEVLDREEPIEKEQELEFSGEKKYHLTTLSPILDSEGKVDKIIGSGKDITGRKKAEEALKQYKMSIEGSDDLISACDENYYYNFANKTYREYHGVGKNELEGKKLPNVLGSENFKQNVKPLVDRCLKGERIHYQMNREHPEKGIRTLDISYYPLKTEKNQIQGVVSVMRDITEQKRMEKNLRESEEKYRAITEESHDTIFIIGKNNFLFVNERTTELTGYSKEELYDMNWWELIHPKDREKIKKIDRKGRKGEKVQTRYEARILTKEGKIKHGDFSVTPIKYEGEIAILGTIRDITERKRREKELRESKKRFERMIEEAPLPIMLHAEDGEVLKINEIWTEITGYKPEEIPTISDWAEKAYDKKKTEVKQHINSLHEKKGRTSEGEFKIETKDGNKRIWNFMSTNLGKLPDERSLVLSMAQDITERERAKERKDFLNTLLRQDLGSKYQTIQGYLQLLEEELNLPEENEQYLKKAISTGQEVDEVLSLAKKLEELEKTEWSGERNLIKDLEHVLVSISGLVKREEVDIEKDFPDKLHKVLGDYSLNTLFTQILVTRIQLAGCKKIRISVREKEKEILLRIEDNGEKLPEDTQKIFSGNLYTGESTGVGGVRYYMLREIGRHNNASIDVKDSELGGARFDVKLHKA